MDNWSLLGFCLCGAFTALGLISSLENEEFVVLGWGGGQRFFLVMPSGLVSKQGQERESRGLWLVNRAGMEVSIRLLGGSQYHKDGIGRGGDNPYLV